MIKKRFVVCVLIILLALSTVAAVANTVWLRANQSVTVRCVDPAGEIEVEFAGQDEAEVTCRVWIDGERE